MPNLLEKLLDSSRKIDPRALKTPAVLEERTNSSQSKAGVFLEERPLELGGLLGELLGAKDKARREKDNEGLPWWLVEAQRVDPVLDELIPRARKKLAPFFTSMLPKEELQVRIRKAVSLASEDLPNGLIASGRHLRDASKELYSLLEGMGPLEILYTDNSVTDILVDAWNSIRCIRRGQALETPFRFRNIHELSAFVETLSRRAGYKKKLDSQSSQFVLREPFTSRITVTGSEENSHSLVIRIPRLSAPTMYDLLKSQMLPAPLAAWLSNVVGLGEYPILVVGSSGSGKTTLLSALTSSVGSDERVTILDAGELVFSHGHSDRIEIDFNSLDEAKRSLMQVVHSPSRRLIVGEMNSLLSGELLGAVETKGFGSLSAMTAPSPFVALSILIDKFAAYTGASRANAYARLSKMIRIIVTLDCIDGKPTLVDLSLVQHAFSEWPQVLQIVNYAGDIHGKKRWNLFPHDHELLKELTDRGAELIPGPTLIEKIDEVLISVV